MSVNQVTSLNVVNFINPRLQQKQDQDVLFTNKLNRNYDSDISTGPPDLLLNVRNNAIVIRGVHDVATDTSAETRKLEGKLYALVNLVTPLPANQKPASVARVYSIRSSNDHRTSVCPSSHQSGVDEHPEAYAETPIVYHHSSKDKALDREDGSQLLAVQCKK
ncbi:hypothetical protein Fmac_018184 [Flemingia macrophylla]|uniref:Uncharacterized protein n=1 Tax=Flemingia macrophylla TaxID=520843 RepID=A0ABD1M4W9_9FABA